MNLGLLLAIIFFGILDIYMTQKVIKYKKREKELRKQIKLYKFVFQKYERNVRLVIQDIENES